MRIFGAFSGKEGVNIILGKEIFSCIDSQTGEL